MDEHAADLLADERLTAMGLLVETHAGVRGLVEADLARHDVPGSTFDVLIRLARSPGGRLPMTELAIQSTLSNSGLTRVVDRLLAAGCVERVRDRDDRRVWWAVLTPKGLDRVLAVLPDHLATIDASLTSVLDPEELRAFTAALRKIRAVVKPGADPANAPQLEAAASGDGRASA
ncbi:MAG: winged helix-turn-helix transcriptional regulator [Acidimicrobiales bacterium]|nr:winged helix-turn-helix transcriptional regulator [Acidimicrobiales bacterium]